MTPYQWTQQASFQWTRVDIVLALLEEAICVLHELQAVSRKGAEKDTDACRRLWQRAELLIAGLISGVNPEIGEVAASFLRLYEYAHHAVSNRQWRELPGVVQVLDTLRSGFEAVREAAIEMERDGVIPPVGTSPQWAVIA
ncbi:hypothetical protein HRbin36_02284 [bacterium HR36]|nr:hypothetical protein HRbin36_02284 [bacterium HR36]